MSRRGRPGRGWGRGSTRGSGREPSDPSDPSSPSLHEGEVGGRAETPSSVRGGDSRGRGRSYQCGGGRARGSVSMPRGRPGANRVYTRVVDDSLAASFRRATLGDSDSLPLRPDFGAIGQEITLRANFFPVHMSQGTLYDYDIAILPVSGTATYRMKKWILHLAEQTTEWRQAGMMDKVAHDGSKRLVSTIQLPQPLAITVPCYNEGESGPPEQGGAVYTLHIRFIQQIDTGNLASYLAGEAHYRDYNISPITSTLNMILTFLSRKTDVMVGRNRCFSYATIEPVGLGSGLEAWKGFCASVRPVDKQLMVRVSTCTTAFYVPGNLARVMIEFRDSSLGARMEAFCRALRIRTTHLGHQRTIKRLARYTAKTYSFDTPEYGQITVENYFRRKYNIRLRFPDIPLVDVSKTETASYLPPEVCDILPGQPYRKKLTDELTAWMHDTARQLPDMRRAATINQVRNQLGLDLTRPELRAFGITIGPDMAVVPGRILPRPAIKYSSSDALIDDQASWNLRGVQFAVGARLDNWAVLVLKDGSRDEFIDSSDQDLHWAVARFFNMCSVSGMHITDKPTYVTAQLPHRTPTDPLRQAAIATIRNALLSVNGKPALVLVMLANHDEAVYGGLKHLFDVSLDVATVCVQSSKFRRGNPYYLANVALKINMKLGGINHKLDPESARWLNSVPTMIVGIYVTHPSPGSVNGTPSIAAVVASVDNDFAQYPAALEMQESKREMVSNLKNMMVDRLKLFQKRNNGKLPERIVVYRSGVSEGLFNVVRSHEYPLIMEAFSVFSRPQTSYRPKLAIITCNKRHHVRFYPIDDDSAGSSGNTPPGTVVDRGITAVYDFDFFLQSHGVAQGTARPIHYYVIHDGIGFKADEVQKLTNSLCYTFARATKAVSRASPVCYAEAACQRGRCYLRKLSYGHLDDGTTVSGIEIRSAHAAEGSWEEAQRLWCRGVSKSGLKDTMFYL